MPTNVDRYWDQYLRSLPEGVPRPARYAQSGHFGIVPEDAPEITVLVLNGTKTASGSLLWTYEAEGSRPPEPRDLGVVTNGHDDPVCILETTEVQVIPYDEVGEEWAIDGGEGDQTLASWRRIYWDFIVSECAKIGREPSKKAPLVMERFRVVYREPFQKD